MVNIFHHIFKHKSDHGSSNRTKNAFKTTRKVDDLWKRGLKTTSRRWKKWCYMDQSLIIAHEIEIWEASMLTILHEDLETNKLSTCWIPKILTSEKLCRQELCKENLAAVAYNQSQLRINTSKMFKIYFYKACFHNAFKINSYCQLRLNFEFP